MSFVALILALGQKNSKREEIGTNYHSSPASTDFSALLFLTIDCIATRASIKMAGAFETVKLLLTGSYLTFIIVYTIWFFFDIVEVWDSWGPYVAPRIVAYGMCYITVILKRVEA